MTAPVIERILGRVAIVGECWIFRGALSPDGYGSVKHEGRARLAHRVAYDAMVGPIPAGMTIDHVADRGCRSRACVNPAHLEPVPSGVNSLRGNGPPAQNARMVTCRLGHPLTSNARQRVCLTCRRESNRKSAERARSRGIVWASRDSRCPNGFPIRA